MNGGNPFVPSAGSGQALSLSKDVTRTRLNFDTGSSLISKSIKNQEAETSPEVDRFSIG
jgi:hypothetical protein